MKTLNYTITALLIITLITSALSLMNSAWDKWLILILSGIKFILVSFQFMEMKKAHTLWKGFIIGFVFLFVLMMGLLNR